MARGKQAAADQAPVKALWDLPDGWRWERLDSVAPVNPRRNFDDLPSDAQLTFLGMASVAELTGVLGLTEFREMSAVRSGFTKFRSGDVIFAKITPCMENGKLAIIPDLPHNMGAGSTEFHVLEPQQISARYLFHWLSQETFRNRAEHNMTGTAGQKRVPTDWLRDTPIPMPQTPDEQEAITTRIDALFAEIAAGEAALAAARAGVETYRKALLKAAVTGELTADWRREQAASGQPQESGQALLTRILTDRRTRWHADPKNAKKKYVEPAGPDIDGLPELPEGWVWANLDQLSTHEVRNGLSIKDTGEPTEVRALRLGALAGNEVDWSVFRHLPRSLASVAGYRLQDGDLLVSRANGSPELVGKASLCIDPPADMIFPDTAIRFRLLGGEGLRQWLVRVWNSLIVRHQIGNLAKTTAGILKISQGDISQIAVPIPSVQEMALASRIVEERLAMAAQSDFLQTLSATAATLRQSILAAAFRGDLIP